MFVQHSGQSKSSRDVGSANLSIYLSFYLSIYLSIYQPLSFPKFQYSTEIKRLAHFIGWNCSPPPGINIYVYVIPNTIFVRSYEMMFSVLSPKTSEKKTLKCYLDQHTYLPTTTTCPYQPTSTYLPNYINTPMSTYQHIPTHVNLPTYLYQSQNINI